MYKKPNGVTQEHIWIAEYYSGSLKEFNEDNSQNSFYDINKEELQRFGMNDLGWVECYKGTFNLRGNSYELIYKEGDKTIPLTGQDMFYKDIITYKKAHADAEMTKANGSFTNTIVAYYFGYKTEFKTEEAQFNLKVIASKPVGGDLYLDIHLVSSESLGGELVVIKNGKEIQKYNAPLEKNIAGGLQWKVI